MSHVPRRRNSITCGVLSKRCNLRAQNTPLDLTIRKDEIDTDPYTIRERHPTNGKRLEEFWNRLVPGLLDRSRSGSGDLCGDEVWDIDRRSDECSI